MKIRYQLLIGILLMSLCLLAGCTNDDLLILKQNITNNITTYVNGSNDGTGGWINNSVNTSTNLNVNINNSLTVIKNTTLNNLVITGNLSVKRPYAMFSDNTTQRVTATATAYPMNFSITEDNYLVSIDSSRRNITFQQTGDYLIELSIMGLSSVANTHLEVWVRKNGVNVPRSNSRYEFKGVNSEAIISVPFILDMMTNDTMTIMYAGDNTGVILPTTANTSYSPVTPCCIMTISKISEIIP